MSLISIRYILSHCSVCQMPQYRKRKAYCDQKVAQNPQRIQAQKLSFHQASFGQAHQT